MMVLFIILVVTLAIKVVLILAFLFNFKKEVLIVREEDLPTASILVAARNEEAVLKNCIESLLKLDYPRHKIEILLGNDHSTDATEAICAKYTEAYPFIKSIPIVDNYKGLIAKSNVIAQLAAQSDADVLAIIDADMQVSSKWLKAMVSPTAKDFDMVSGFSVVESDSLISSLQRVDWINGVMVLKALADLGKPVTVLGNNMLITNKAYKSIGGFEAVGATATEDNDLTIRVYKAGYKVYQNVNAMGASTQPIKTMEELFSQRKRWVLGGLRHSIPKIAAMFLSRSFLLWASVLTVLNVQQGLLLLAAYLFLELIQLLLIHQKSKVRISLFSGLITPFFNSVFDTFALLKLLLSRKVIWKGRKM